MGKTYRRNNGDKFERKQKRSGQTKSKKNVNYFKEIEENIGIDEKININKYK